MAKFKYSKEMFKVPGFVKEITTNKYVLYIVAFFALTNLLGYIMLNKNICVLLFVLIAYLMTYFTQNMVFVLAVPIFVVGFFAICKGTSEFIVEKYTNMKEVNVGDSVVSKSGEMSGVVESKEDGNVTIRLSPAEGDDESENSQEPTMTLSESEFMKNWESKSNGDEEEDMMDKDAKDMSDDTLNSMEDEQEEVLDEGFTPANDSSTAKKPKKHMKPGDKKKKGIVGAKTGDKAKGGSAMINPVKTKKLGFENMENGLGSQGMAGLAGDTQSLIKNQKALMDAMQSMGPMLQQAKGMLDSLDVGGLGSAISAITGGNGAAKESFGTMRPLGFSTF